MRKLFQTFAVFVIASLCFATTVKIDDDKAVFHDHKVYQLYWSTETKNPIIVWWTLTSSQALESENASNRANDFRECDLGSASLRDYYKSSYDRGHQAPSNDFDYSKQTSSLTFLMCNICPQSAKLNRGAWKKYEVYGHKLAIDYGRVDIVCGPIYDYTKSPVYIGEDNVRVPDYFFKAFHYVKDGESIVESYLFDQAGNVYTTALSYFEGASNIKILF